MMREHTQRERQMGSTGPACAIRQVRAGESGYTLLAVMFILFVLTLSLSAAMPKVIKSLQRDQEIETQQRGKQYIRAIQLYYKKFNAFPPSIDALMKQNNLRYLRKKYKDPTTGKEDWKLIRYGQAKTQTLGFFGKPLSGAGLGGLAGGGIGPVGTNTNSNLFGGNPTDSNSSTQSSAQPDSSTQSSGSDSTTPSGSGLGYSQSGISGSGQNGQSSSGFGSSNTNQAGSGTGLTGQTFGGGGIIGVEPGNAKATLKVYRKKSHFNEWEFIYDPALERYYESGAAGFPTGQNPANGTNPTGGGFGGSGTGNSFGNGSNGFGNSGSSFGGTPSGNQFQ